MKGKTRAKLRTGRRRGSPRPLAPFFTLGQVAQAVEGRLLGRADLRLSGVETLDRSGPADLSWVADARYARQAQETRAGALLAASQEDAGSRPAVLVPSPTLALATWLQVWRPAQRPPPGISKGAFVHPTARLGPGVSIAAGAAVKKRARIGARTVLSVGVFVGEEAEIGEDCTLYANAVVLDRCRVGSRCILHAGAVIGSDGFRFVWDGKQHRKIPQLGIVRVEDDVEIGANSAIDRATLGETVIGRGTKIDNLVQIGHNVVVGEDSLLCGQAGVAGSSLLGKRVTLAGQVGISDHVTIGEGAVVTGQAGIVRGDRVPPGAVVSGMPAAPHREFLRRAALIARLPELARRLEELEKTVRAAEKGEKPWKSESPKS